MKKNNILLFIYNNHLYLNCNESFDSIQLDKDIISNGRLNNIDKLIKRLKSSKIIKNSIYKIVSDKLMIIYFANYNDLELAFIKNNFIEKGFSDINLIDIKDILDLNYNYIFSNNGFVYYILSGKKHIIDKDIFTTTEFPNSKTIMDLESYNKYSLIANKTRIYAIDNIIKYIFNRIC